MARRRRPLLRAAVALAALADSGAALALSPAATAGFRSQATFASLAVDRAFAAAAEGLRRSPSEFPLDIGDRRFVAAAALTISLPWPLPALDGYSVALYADRRSSLWGRPSTDEEVLQGLPGGAALVYNITGAFLDRRRFAAAVPLLAAHLGGEAWAADVLRRYRERFATGPAFHEGTIVILTLRKDGIRLAVDNSDLGLVGSPGPGLAQAQLAYCAQLPGFQEAWARSLQAGLPSKVSDPAQAVVKVGLPWSVCTAAGFFLAVLGWCLWRALLRPLLCGAAPPKAAFRK